MTNKQKVNCKAKHNRLHVKKKKKGRWGEKGEKTPNVHTRNMSEDEMCERNRKVSAL